MRFVFVVSLALAVAFGAAPASAADAEVRVYFTKGEQFAAVKRATQEEPLAGALRALFAGPTDVERRQGLRTNIPDRAELLGVVRSGAVATVDVSSAFTVGPRASLAARLAQVVYTATAVEGVRRVRVTVSGARVGRVVGLPVDAGVGRADFGPVPMGGAPEPRPPSPYSALVRSIQQQLADLRYLPPASDDGLLGPQTRHAILAFEGWQRLPRTGRATQRLLAAVRAADVPAPRAGAGSRIEVSIARQVALIVDRGEVVRAIHVSTGAPGFDTPKGAFRVFRKELRSWSYPYRVWLPYASYFVGGVAFHESPDVPARPASHGCVRVPSIDAPLVYQFATLGTRVVVW